MMMRISKQDLRKIKLYFGLTDGMRKSIRYWMSLNPKEKFYVDEFIDYKLNEDFYLTF